MLDSPTTRPAADAIVIPKRICVLLNGAAGTCDSQPNACAAIEASFRERGIAAEVAHVKPGELEDAARHTLEKLRQGTADAIVAGGGDGTISTVASVMARTGYPMGVLPLGTLNHFAKDLKLPLRLDEAIEVIAAGAIREVDVAEANGIRFINNSSIGIYPYMVLQRERRRQAGLPKWLAMIPALLKTLRYLPLRRLSITAGGRSETFRSPCVFVGNNAYGLAGASFGKRERLDQNSLCLYIAKTQDRLAFVRLVLRSLLGTIDSAEEFQSFAVPTVLISSRRKRLLASFDGEIAIVRTPLNYAIMPRALRVFVKDA